MIIDFFYRIIEKVFVIFDITKIYETKTGIKIINSPLKNYNLNIKKTIYLNINDLYLGFDSLNDSYSLCDVPLEKSPHYEFMKALKNNNNIKNTNYFKRYYNGSLDGRRRRRINNEDIKRFKIKFNMRLKEIEEKSYEPIQVYRIGEKYYIADGKHRASLCLLYYKKIKCVEISNDFLKDSIRMWMYKKMKKKENRYKKNIKLIENSINYYE